MAYTTINKPSDYFNTVLYTGTGSSNAITGVGFQPDFIWAKARDVGNSHYAYDALRGIYNYLKVNDTDANSSVGSNTLLSFDSDGMTLGSGDPSNTSGASGVSWTWKANGAGSSNTDGSITSTVSANTTSGFSIVSYTGTGANATVGHGLGSAPKVVMVKKLSATSDWVGYFSFLGNTKNIRLNTTDALDTNATAWNSTDATSSVFSLGTFTEVNASSATFVAYCFAEKKGFSKFGSYTGNGSTDGSFIWLGFKPAFIIIKRTDAIQSWVMFDNKRIGYNPNNYLLFPNATTVEGTSNYIDILSNGFKTRTADPEWNGSGASYIYMAFAEHPLVSSTGTPVTAR